MTAPQLRNFHYVHPDDGMHASARPLSIVVIAASAFLALAVLSFAFV